ncbi:hypothetical protein A7U60_g387 [Sanghuangporus baumii]|uniref:Retrotransposon gag domain-containing protein n=1 Tax=Sanghuangporus baumii TaxID=108892 RepID=A0A9Q5I5G7_SANBA|nr:hypothetical protein A7U60_g387 [Sanghuangporus baumii]
MSQSSEVSPVRTPSRSLFHPQPIKVDLTDDQRAALLTNTRWSASQEQYIVKSGDQTFIAWWDETVKKWAINIDKPDPAPLVPTDEEEEDEEEEQEMSLSKELITDLAMAIMLVLQAAGEGMGQGSKSNKVHVAKPQDFDGEHGYVDFKRELHLYIYASESEFRTSKAKIMFALLYMKSSAAASWVESYTSSAIDKHSRIAFKDNWDAFLKKLDTSFDDPAHSQKAFKRLNAMYQGDLNTDKFFNKFDICRVDAGLATEAHDEWLMSRLK